MDAAAGFEAVKKVLNVYFSMMSHPTFQAQKTESSGTDVVTNVCWQMWGRLKNYTEELNRLKTHSGRICAVGKNILQAMNLKAGNSLRKRHAVSNN